MQIETRERPGSQRLELRQSQHGVSRNLSPQFFGKTPQRTEFLDHFYSPLRRDVFAQIGAKLGEDGFATAISAESRGTLGVPGICQQIQIQSVSIGLGGQLHEGLGLLQKGFQPGPQGRDSPDQELAFGRGEFYRGAAVAQFQ